MNERINKQTGVALVVVLLVVALVSIIATDMTGRLQYETRRSANLFDYQQARSYAIGLESFAAIVLEKSVKQSPSRDDLGQDWARKGATFQIEAGELSSLITDVNQCFNLNSIVVTQDKNYIVDKSSVNYIGYRRLLGLLDLPLTLSDSLVDWIDSDQQLISPDGAEDLDYELASPPYRAANNLLADVSELRLIKGYDEKVIEKLTPYVCALPEVGKLKLNLNTLDVDKPELLSMLIKGLSLNAAAQLLADRDENGFSDLESFWKLKALDGLNVTEKEKAVLHLDSDYFMLKATARVGRGHVKLTTLFKQVNNNKITIIWRRFGATQ